ncbi:hypothetical protein E8E11_003742 [Didymella keratinophila]|nr:hypothetical protein E8E11_003742 [Didymella keratinophila]
MAAACSVTIEKPSMRTVMGQFPRLRIRAHYIDTVRVTNLVRRRANNGAIAVNNAGDPFPAPNWQGRSPAGDVLVAHDLVTNLEEYPQLLAGDYRWMLDYFKTVVELPKRVEWSSEDTFTNLKDKDLPFVNLHDLRTFVNAIKLHLALLDNWSSRRASFVFATVYSLGFGGRGFHVGDQIWAVDGVTVPLILRKAGSEYKLIGECYLWAALNLDRWTPGTKKGRWLDSYESSPGRTRMIVLDGTANSGRVS